MITNRMLISPERLSRAAREQLYEATNTGRLVAFVGSGLSLVYGQPTWTDFVRRLVDLLEEDLEAFIALNEDSKPERRRLDGQTAKLLASRVRQTVAAARKTKFKDSLVVLELIKRAFEVLDRNGPPSEHGNRYHVALKKLFEFNAIAGSLLARRLSEAGVSSLREDFERRVYTTSFLDALAEAPGAGDELRELNEAIRAEPDRDGRRRSNRPLPLDRRSFVSIYLAVGRAKGLDIAAAIEKAVAQAPNSRPLLDPLYELDEWLHIRRYLTTNYDLALEDLHMSDGVPLTVPHLEERRDLTHSDVCGGIIRQLPDGRVVRSETVDGRHVAPLVEFALGSVDNAIHIYHHHGRIDRPSTLVAADGEYNRNYRSESGLRTSFDHAYDALIAGNPTIFVGSGMNEEELNRTLRASVSNPAFRTAPVIVLRSALSAPQIQIMEEVALATRLGAYVIHYGAADRGARYCLRDHMALLDRIACDHGLDKVLKRANGEKVWETPEDCPKVGEITKENWDVDNRFRLLRDLDFDWRVIEWLLPGRRELSGTVGTKVAEPGQLLLGDYLDMLGQKLVTAALRHELRQLGHEAAAFYKQKSTRIDVRAASGVPLGAELFVRHVSSRQADGTRPAPKLVRLDDNGLARRDDAKGFNGLGDLIASKRKKIRTVVLGERGSGKGSLLANYVETLRGDGRPRLVVNCCYGQEVDSIATVVVHFLEEAAGWSTGEDLRPRRARLNEVLRHNHSGSVWNRLGRKRRPLIVLAGIDRLFGTDEEILAVDFEWLLRRLLDDRSEVDLVVTGSPRCRRFFKSLPASSSVDFWLAEPMAQNDGKPRGVLRKLTGTAATREPEHQAAAPLSIDWLQRQEMSHGDRRIDLVVGRALGVLERWNQQLAGIGGGKVLVAVDTGAMALELVRTLSFIGLPTTAAVLVSAPRVRRGLATNLGRRIDLSNAVVRETLIQALAKGVAMGVVSIVEPARGALNRGDASMIAIPVWGVDATAAASKGGASAAGGGRTPEFGEHELAAVRIACRDGHRFVVHRLVNQVMRDRFGVPNSAIVLSDSYNLSLYAVQPDDAAVPEQRVIHELEQLSDYLMNAWKDVRLSAGEANGDDVGAAIRKAREGLLNGEGYADPLSRHYLARLRSLRRRLGMGAASAIEGLRAAGGVVRGYYSAVNLFALDLDDPRSRKDEGGMSAIAGQKLRLRQLLDLAIEADVAIEVASPKSGSHDPADSNLASFLHEVSCVATDLASEDVGRRQMLNVERVSVLSEKGPARSTKPASIAELELALPPSLADVRRTGLAEALDPDLTSRRADQRPFFAGETVWLLNERGVLALAQGDLYTAATTFKLAREANAPIERDRYHPNRLRLDVNDALVLIERGRVADARRMLTLLREGLGETGPTDGNGSRLPADDRIDRSSREGRLITALCFGYTALCDQIFGFDDLALRGYSAAIADLGELREQRALAIFEVHRASVLARYPDRGADAEGSLLRAIDAANGGRHTDIFYRAKVAKADSDYHAKRISPADAMAIYDAAVNYGYQLEMHRNAVEALSARAQLQRDLGDFDAASRDLARAAAVASQYGMTLRRIWLRVMFGKVYELRGDLPNARLAFGRAVDEGSRISYARAVEVANTHLLRLRRS